jgi:sialidase-1
MNQSFISLKWFALMPLLLSVFMTMKVTSAEEADQHSMVFVNGTNGYVVYRTPTMVVTHSGTILAFAEGRVNSHEDEDDIDIVLRRSEDGGKTWGPMMVLEDDGKNPCKNQVPVVLPSGRILVVWLWNEWVPSESDRTTRQVYVTYSDDDGLTWSASRDITYMAYGEGWGWYGTGPCHAIVKEREPNAGRIIIPARHNIRGVQGMKSHILYSDDQGETWHIGAIALRESTNESTVVELSNGDLMMNSRNGDNNQNVRLVQISRDGGLTFDSLYLDLTLRDAGACQGTILKHSLNEETGKYNILFSNPHHATDRVNGTIHLSHDDGKTWSKRFRYSPPAPRFSGYSDIAVLNEAGDIAILFEVGASHVKPHRWYCDSCGIGFRVIGFDQIDQPVHHIAPGNWAVYDGSMLLEDAWPEWSKTRTTLGSTDGRESVYYSVVDDPDIEGNKLLKAENLTWSAREGWEHDWQLGWDRTGLTMVFRAKPTEDILNYTAGGSSRRMLYVSPRNGTFMEVLTFTYPDQLRFNMMSKSVTHSSHDWTIYRITMMRNQIFLYINENPEPVMFGFTNRQSSENRLLFGMDTSEPYGSYLDWMVWDLSGAYPPGQGPALPDTLTGLDYVSSAKETLFYEHEKKITIYPNPAKEMARISYVVDQEGLVVVGLYDIHGKHVTNLVSSMHPPGHHEAIVRFPGIPQGVYICRMVAGYQTHTIKVVVSHQ